MLDLQLVRLGKPSIDLAYFFGSSTKPEWRQQNLTRSLKFYHECLVDQLNYHGFQSKICSFKELQVDFDHHRPFMLVMGGWHAILHLKSYEQAGLHMEQTSNDPEEHKKFFAKYLQFNLKEAQSNDLMRNRLLGLAKEAAEFKVI